jgi:hypothetical protein
VRDFLRILGKSIGWASALTILVSILSFNWALSVGGSQTPLVSAVLAPITFILVLTIVMLTQYRRAVQLSPGAKLAYFVFLAFFIILSVHDAPVLWKTVFAISNQSVDAKNNTSGKRLKHQNIEQAKDIKKVPDTEQATDKEQSTDIDIVGVWQSEPILGELGFIQSSYTFNEDGSYSNKLDMISFCEEQYGQNCEYLWKNFDGTYSIENGVITLSSKQDKTVKLGKGQSKPDIRIDTDYGPVLIEYLVKLDAGSLVMTGINDNKSVIYKPFVAATEQDGDTLSTDTHDVEQTTDIVGEWQSEPYVWNSAYIQSSYTFKTDDSYSNKVDFLRICKDVPEQNCEYYRMFLEGKYAVKNGVITIYNKEVRTEILHKGKDKPDIRIAPDRPHSGDEYLAKLDSGKLFMTNKKSNELVVFKSLNND